jgi:hypothetical protein
MDLKIETPSTRGCLEVTPQLMRSETKKGERQNENRNIKKKGDLGVKSYD